MILSSGRELEVVGDRVLIIPDEGEERTEVGLYLPRPAVERAAVQGGAVVEVGPGLPLPDATMGEEEPWQAGERFRGYVRMQATVGDYAVFLRKFAVEVRLEGKTYLVVPQSAILVLVRSPRSLSEEGPDDFDLS